MTDTHVVSEVRDVLARDWVPSGEAYAGEVRKLLVDDYASPLTLANWLFEAAKARLGLPDTLDTLIRCTLTTTRLYILRPMLARS